MLTGERTRKKKFASERAKTTILRRIAWRYLTFYPKWHRRPLGSSPLLEMPLSCLLIGKTLACSVLFLTMFFRKLPARSWASWVELWETVWPISAWLGLAWPDRFSCFQSVDGWHNIQSEEEDRGIFLLKILLLLDLSLSLQLLLLSSHVIDSNWEAWQNTHTNTHRVPLQWMQSICKRGALLICWFIYLFECLFSSSSR